ncbi:MAG: aldo/keto reductase [Rectinemataceae bacterium]|nr:aldo/keto reductase [Rectinemataceae bacterium]
MEMIRFGRTGLTVSRTGFGAIPIQRIAEAESTKLLRAALDAGVTLYDTARGYSDSEEKLGKAFRHERDRVVLATKTPSADPAKILVDLETSLRNLRTDHVDIYQFHNPKSLGLVTGAALEAVLRAREQGKIRFIGITNHSLAVAAAALESGLFDSVQYPFNYLSTEGEEAFVRRCAQLDVGFLAMKAMSGGLITDARLSFSHLRRFPGVVPIWGMQRQEELAQFIELERNPPSFDDPEIQTAIARDRVELSGSFCRGCGYCLPCPAGISIPMAARVSLFVKRMPVSRFMTEEFRADMARVRDCIECRACAARCPYGLDVPGLLKRQLGLYEDFRNGEPAAEKPDVLSS